jgi:hypothetical protein
VPALVGFTRFDSKRVKDQMTSDTTLGFVAEEDGVYSLTNAGEALLTRFEEYRKANGIPLPTHEDAQREGRAHEDSPNSATRDPFGVTAEGTV